MDGGAPKFMFGFLAKFHRNCSDQIFVFLLPSDVTTFLNISQ